MNAHHDKPSPDTDNIFGLVKQQIAIKNGPFEEVLFIIHGDFPASPVTFPETNSSHLKIDCWKTTFLSFWNPAYFQGRLLLVSGGVVYQSVLLRPKRMICPRPCGMAPRKAKKRGRREEFW